jgi:hypothetical protein
MKLSTFNEARFLQIFFGIGGGTSHHTAVFIASRGKHSISVIDILTRQQTTYTVLVSETQEVTLFDCDHERKVGFMSNDDAVLQIELERAKLVKDAEDAEKTFQQKRKSERDYDDFRGRVAQKVHWPESSTT